jgi:aminoglycoside N3'-acetyltransferase
LKTRLDEFSDRFADLAGSGGRPIVVYSGLWTVARAWRMPLQELVEGLMATIADAAGSGRTLLMPTFTKGYVNGFLDLDTEPGTTGVLAEHMRNLPGTGRTVSAFFSFAVRGPDRDALCSLRPEHAWGDTSVYAWMEEQDAVCVTIGVTPQIISAIHRVEWHCRDVIDYRFPKLIAGQVRHGGRETPLEEQLFVRRLDLPVRNDFDAVVEPLSLHGLRETTLDGVTLASVGTKSIVNTLVPIVRERPDFLLAKAP